MEQPPGSLDDLQPQDLSTSSIPTVIDLTRKGEECVLNSTSLNGLQMVKSPGWYPNTGASNPGLPSSETGTSDSTPQSRDGPDNAFSHTTVTLSYVSRSHVFSTHDSLSQCSPLYGVPPISKFSVHSPCDSDEGLGDTGYALNQHYLVGGPLELTTQSELFHSLSQAQMRPEIECLTKEPQELNGGVNYSDRDVDKRVKDEEENGPFWEKNGGLENGQDDSFSSSGVCAEPSPVTLTPATGEDVVFLMSKKQDPAVVPDRVGATRDLYSLSREYVSPLEDPVSPSTTSLDNVEDVLILPQASSSPSGDNSYLETTDDEVAWDGLRTKGAIEPGSGISVSTTRLDSSAENKQPVHRRKAVLEPLIDLTDDLCVSDVSGNKPKTVIPRMNGNAKALQRTLKEKKLPKSKKEQEEVSHPAHSRQVSPVNSKRKPSLKSSRQYVHQTPKEPEHHFHPDPLMDVHMARFPPPPPLSKSPKKRRGKAKCKATGSKTSPTAKTKGAGTFKRRQKKPKWSQVPSMFSPKEPEIKLKYVNYKEEKRDFRLDSFSPFVRVKHQQLSSSLCTVINYPEEVGTQQKKGQHQQAHPCGFNSAVVPCTSCLQLGRASTDSQHQRALVCCLCGQAANAMDLGDLHGPYYPEGHQPSTKRPAVTLGLKEDEDDYSNSDSSSSWSIRGRGRKCANPPVPRALRPGAHLKQKGLLRSQRWTADNTGSPAAKQARSDADSVDVEDWYSPPVLPLDPCEYWLHEDCGIWSAGVFLVKGKVYGLEEAVKVAQETMCSACSDPGATLGCFFKVCPNKYHYRCALESDVYVQHPTGAVLPLLLVTMATVDHGSPRRQLAPVNLNFTLCTVSPGHWLEAASP
ncbi:hypothetical protein FQN60_002700 [Etheostoma spectabile]|uniref:PHD-type domain-containing protein n=1 Tax=Etheostoma spectabile TaxID=54343 RepID=A0A5J5CKC3_9PERO|nr:hypothetical protein FQN60_002700 [Etheostoma spectabile]